MNFIKLLPVILSPLLLGAHFFREGQTVFALISAAVLFILLIRRPWAAGLVQTILVIEGISGENCKLTSDYWRMYMGRRFKGNEQESWMID